MAAVTSVTAPAAANSALMRRPLLHSTASVLVAKAHCTARSTADTAIRAIGIHGTGGIGAILDRGASRAHYRRRTALMVERTRETIDQPLPYPRDRLLDFLEQMVLIRNFDEKTKEMLARDRIRGYCHWNIGEEASVVGAVAAMREQDQMVTSYRDHGYALARGTAPGAV